jgi:hypothetical protein
MEVPTRIIRDSAHQLLCVNRKSKIFHSSKLDGGESFCDFIDMHTHTHTHKETHVIHGWSGCYGWGLEESVRLWSACFCSRCFTVGASGSRYPVPIPCTIGSPSERRRRPQCHRWSSGLGRTVPRNCRPMDAVSVSSWNVHRLVPMWIKVLQG